MELISTARRAMLSRLSLVVLAVLVTILAALQYRWIGEVSQAEQKTLEEKLQTGLNAVRRDFNNEIASAVVQLIPPDPDIEPKDLPDAYALRFRQWQDTGMFRKAGIGIPGAAGPQLKLWNPSTEQLETAAWPEDWRPLRQWMEERALQGAGPRGPDLQNTTLLDIPRFATGPRSPNGVIAWLFLDIDPEYVSRTVLPEVLARHLGPNFVNDYQIDVTSQGAGGAQLYRSDSSMPLLNESSADQTIGLFDARIPQGPPGPGGGGRQGKRSDRPKGNPGGPPPNFFDGGGKDFGKGFKDDGGKGFGGPGGPNGGRWLLLARHRSGSLAAVVERARVRNLAVSGFLLLLLLATAGLVVRLSRETERVAEMQMDFVAGVSHELRTPLAVIRTAAYNLRGKMSGNPTQVEKYGALIQQESEKLGGIVEQVLRYSSARAGQVLQNSAPLDVGNVIEESLKSARALAADSGRDVPEVDVEPHLPLVSGDAMALRHAFENLIGNAMKYGGKGKMNIAARPVFKDGGRTVEVRFSDSGPGIPANEREHIFDAFYRGKKAVEDQIHGTGLGLNLVKKIVEAHGGSIRLDEHAAPGATFVVSLPATANTHIDELAHTPSGR